jgi:hypothetical protein
MAISADDAAGLTGFLSGQVCLVGQATVPAALALLVLKGLLDLGIASHGGVSLGWHVALTSKMVGAPSCGVFCGGQACFVVPSLSDQSGLCAARSLCIGRACMCSHLVWGPCGTASCTREPSVEPSGGTTMSCARTLTLGRVTSQRQDRLVLVVSQVRFQWRCL